jgi:hypothetical protein
MAGQLTIDTLKASSGVLATQNGMTGISKAWVNFNGTGTVAIRDSFNVSSITDNGTGAYTVNFTTAMPNTNYVISCTASSDGFNTGTCRPTQTSTYTTSAVQIFCDGITGATNARFDATRVLVAVFSS